MHGRLCHSMCLVAVHKHVHVDAFSRNCACNMQSESASHRNAVVQSPPSGRRPPPCATAAAALVRCPARHAAAPAASIRLASELHVGLLEPWQAPRCMHMLQDMLPHHNVAEEISVKRAPSGLWSRLPAGRAPMPRRRSCARGRAGTAAASALPRPTPVACKARLLVRMNCDRRHSGQLKAFTAAIANCSCSTCTSSI